MRKKLRVETFKEALKRRKENSYDVLDGWGLADQVDYENQIYEDNGEFYDMNGYDKTMSLSNYLLNCCCYETSIPIQKGITKNEAKTIIQKQEALMEELWKLMQTKKYNVQWSENESYVTISRTFNIPHSMFDKWLEDKKENKNKEE